MFGDNRRESSNCLREQCLGCTVSAGRSFDVFYHFRVDLVCVEDSFARIRLCPALIFWGSIVLAILVRTRFDARLFFVFLSFMLVATIVDASRLSFIIILIFFELLVAFGLTLISFTTNFLFDSKEI